MVTYTHLVKFLSIMDCRVFCTAFPNQVDLIILREMAKTLFSHILYSKSLCFCDSYTHLSNEVQCTTHQISNSACCSFIIFYLNHVSSMSFVCVCVWRGGRGVFVSVKLYCLVYSSHQLSVLDKTLQPPFLPNRQKLTHSLECIQPKNTQTSFLSSPPFSPKQTIHRDKHVSVTNIPYV